MKNSIIQKITNTTDTISTIPLRLSAGIIFSAHGGQKLFSWFGGYGLEGTGQWMESIGLSPGYLMALMAGSAELFGGILLILGLLTRPAALVLAFTMLIAIFSVHINNGLFMSNNGFEFGLALFALSLALLVQGGGKYSIDKIINQKFK
ncbi:DoxX family protein [Paraglaciecola aquimarina]|uniref:DoxX family protein n=1 Tax=Paraglaciecola algarum TaxID=3050085 RepID=A0ABS9DA19_9ALTE|nr:DoxX family protein [Paraglaciecola sp. G1-23]MCF2948476.1 DoxX family protein [Paraglaciecola sp. G1-23]